MIRAPGVNSILNAARTVKQLVSRRNAFVEAVSSASPAATAKHQQPFDLRDLASPSLWLAACRRTRRAITSAIDAKNAASLESQLTQLSSLLKLEEGLRAVGALRGKAWIRAKLSSVVSNWYADSLRQGFKQGLIKPGVTRGVSARTLLWIKATPSTEELMKREQKQRFAVDMAMKKGLAGKGHLHLSDDDLTGLSDNMKSIWASNLGKWAFWRKAKYKVPVGRDAANRILPFCQNKKTRERIFEAYYDNFGSDVDEAALQLLRTRKELAQSLGFETWADYEIRPLAIGDVNSARKLLDTFWREAQPGLKAFYQKLDARSKAASSSPRGTRRLSAAAAESRSLSDLDQPDEAFYRAFASREADSWKLATYLPAEQSIPRILEIVGRAYNVHFREADQPEIGVRLFSGWHRDVLIYEVVDGPPNSGSSGLGGNQLLGHLYLDLYQRATILGRPMTALAGALSMAKGHAHICMNLMNASWGHKKLFNPEEVIAIAHEVGHAVHMLCLGHNGTTPQEFEDLPLDLLELPSTLAETIALQPSVIAQYARHRSSGGAPPDSLVRSCHRDLHFFLKVLQSAQVTMGLHSDAFDPHTATKDDLREKATALWQRYSPVQAHPAFTPFGDDIGLHVAMGSNHIAYLMCYLRVDTILHTQQRGSAQLRAAEASRRWLSTDFGRRVRAQLLDRPFQTNRLATLLPTLEAEKVLDASGAARAIAHPLPPLPGSAAALLGRAANAEAA
mmetsp:Transcript_20371/g.44381  ORF Transcript_20371/g.44381 Transcript_20371/m.44381 type:complete len:735 (+) Transcript_20371:34-2238(+)